MSDKLDTYREIELAEGVRIQLRPVGVLPRLLARAIDTSIFAIFLFVLFIFMGLISSLIGAEPSGGVYMLFLFILMWFYDPLMESSRWGGSLGKMAMKLRVVKTSGAPVDFGSAFLRGLLFWIDLLPWFGVVGVCSILTSRYSQRLGDLVAGTLVISRQQDVAEEFPELPIASVAPGLVLLRSEELAFLEFAHQHRSMSTERLEEITSPLADLQHHTQATSPVNYALGVAKWISHHEG